MSQVLLLVYLLFLVGLFVGFVFSLIWIYRDANRRGKPGFLVALLAALIAWPVSLLVWVYFTEGVVRAWSDKGLSAALAGVEIALCLTLFVAVTVHVRTRLKAAGPEAVEADKLRHAAEIGAAADPVPPARS